MVQTPPENLAAPVAPPAELPAETLSPSPLPDEDTEAAAAPSIAIPASTILAASGLPLPNLPALAGNPEVASPADAPAPPGSVATPTTAPDPAQELFERVSTRTGLTDGQAEKLEGARKQIADGRSADALANLSELNRQLDADSRVYVVAPGDSLWSIAGFQGAYGNPHLWPLIWQANQRRLPQPDAIYSRLRLVIPMHPEVSEITAALALASQSSTAAKQPAEAPDANPAPPAPSTQSAAPRAAISTGRTPVVASDAAPLPSEAANPP